MGLGHYLKSEPHNSHFVNEHFQPDKGWKHITLSMGNRKSFVRFEFLNNAKQGSRLRLDLNPRKLGPKGFKQLAQVLGGGVKPPFKLPTLIEQARITRLDLAVDFVGLHVSEVAAWHKDQAKRSMYVGADGSLETIYLHRKVPPKQAKYDQWGEPKKLTHGSKPAGAVLLRVYDRVRERTTILRPAPFGPAAVTRAELVISRFNKWSKLASLPDMEDRFCKLRVGFIDSQFDGHPSLWRRYASLRRTVPHEEAVAMLGLQSIAKTAFAAAWNVPKADLIAPGETWSGWKAGLEQTGLGAFISATAAPI